MVRVSAPLPLHCLPGGLLILHLRRAFGRNSFGQLGLGNTGDVLEPTRVESLSHCQIMRTGCGAEHSVAADCNGRVFSFGWGRYGNLGNGKNGDKYTPELIQGELGSSARLLACS